MLDEDTIKKMVKDIFISKGLIEDDEEDKKSYSHKPHLANLPYDLRSTNVDELTERLEVITDEIAKRENRLRFLKDKSSKKIYYNNQFNARISETTDKLLEGYDIKTGRNSNQGTLPLSDGREIPINFGHGSDLYSYAQAGYDVSKYVDNIIDFSKNFDNIVKNLNNDMKYDNFTYSEDNLNLINEYGMKSKYNLEFMNNIKEDGKVSNVPSKYLLEDLDTMNMDVEEIVHSYTTHKKFVEEGDTLIREINDLKDNGDKTQQKINSINN